MTTMRKPEEFTPAEVQGRQAEYPGMTEAQARISLERQQVYGDAFENHAGIAATWVGELQGWGQHISEGKPLPPDVVARMMALLKLNRCRLDYHEDNYIDHAVYALFAQAWQKRRVVEGGPMPLANPHRPAMVTGIDTSIGGCSSYVVLVDVASGTFMDERVVDDGRPTMAKDWTSGESFHIVNLYDKETSAEMTKKWWGHSSAFRVALVESAPYETHKAEPRESMVPSWLREHFTPPMAEVEKDKDLPQGAKVWPQTVRTGSPTDIRDWLIVPHDPNLREGNTILFEVPDRCGIGYMFVGKKDTGDPKAPCQHVFMRAHSFLKGDYLVCKVCGKKVT